MGSRHVSHCWTLSFDSHLDDQLRLSSEMYQLRTRLEKNVRWWVRNPHLTNAQPLAFSFQLVFWSWFYWWNGLLSRTCFLGLVYLVLQCCSLNVTPQLPRPKKSRASNPSIRSPASNEMISDSVELLETDVCFSCTSSWWGHMFGFQWYLRLSPRGSFRVLKIASKVWVLK